MEGECNAQGIARASLDREEEVEGAHVRWCGVVGGWFFESGWGIEKQWEWRSGRRRGGNR